MSENKLPEYDATELTEQELMDFYREHHTKPAIPPEMAEDYKEVMEFLDKQLNKAELILIGCSGREQKSKFEREFKLVCKIRRLLEIAYGGKIK